MHYSWNSTAKHNKGTGTDRYLNQQEGTNMATFYVDKHKLEGVADIAARSLNDKGFSSLEVMLGLSQFIGQLAVMEGSTPIQMQELLEVSSQRMVATAQTGAEAKGFARPSSMEVH